MKKIPQIIIIIALLVLNFHQWRERKADANSYTSNMEVLNDSISHYQNKEGKWVAERKAFQGEKKELEELLKTQGDQLVKALKKTKPTTATKIVTETKIDTVFISYKVPVEIDFSSPFSKKTKFYSINGLATSEGINIFNITIPNEQSVVVGKKKLGFLKYEYRAEVTNSNPLIQVTELAAFNFQERKKRFHFGPFAGLSTQGQATFGLGITYSVISF